jgi:hypothetical protein
MLIISPGIHKNMGSTGTSEDSSVIAYDKGGGRAFAQIGAGDQPGAGGILSGSVN